MTARYKSWTLSLSNPQIPSTANSTLLALSCLPQPCYIIIDANSYIMSRSTNDHHVVKSKHLRLVLNRSTNQFDYARIVMPPSRDPYTTDPLRYELRPRDFILFTRGGLYKGVLVDDTWIINPLVVGIMKWVLEQLGEAVKARFRAFLPGLHGDATLCPGPVTEDQRKPLSLPPVPENLPFCHEQHVFALYMVQKKEFLEKAWDEAAQLGLVSQAFLRMIDERGASHDEHRRFLDYFTKADSFFSTPPESVSISNTEYRTPQKGIGPGERSSYLLPVPDSSSYEIQPMNVDKLERAIAVQAEQALAVPTRKASAGKDKAEKATRQARSARISTGGPAKARRLAAAHRASVPEETRDAWDAIDVECVTNLLESQPPPAVPATLPQASYRAPQPQQVARLPDIANSSFATITRDPRLMLASTIAPSEDEFSLPFAFGNASAGPSSLPGRTKGGDTPHPRHAEAVHDALDPSVLLAEASGWNSDPVPAPPDYSNEFDFMSLSPRTISHLLAAFAQEPRGAM